MDESVGQQLRKAREASQLSLEQASQATHIRLHYLRALEAGEFDTLPSLVQARGFIRSYAGYLGIQAVPLLDALEPASEPSMEPAPESAPQPEISTQTGEQASAAIFVDLGQRLKSHRELLGLNLEEIERQTHLRLHYLIALEAGNLEGLPSPVQGRGMLNNYAAFLGLDPEPLLLRFAEGLQARLAIRQAARPSPTRPVHRQVTPPSPLRRLFSGEFLLGAFFIVFLAGFVLWGAVRIFALRSAQQPSPSAPSIAEVLLAPSTPTDTPSPPPPSPTAPALPQATAATPATGEAVFAPPAEGVSVYVTVRQRAWVRVIVDGEIEFEGRVLPGSAYQYTGNSSVEILTGNAAALQIFFNQQDLGPMGLFGQVVDRVYTSAGILTPTPTVTWTPTATSRPTQTSRVTETPLP